MVVLVALSKSLKVINEAYIIHHTYNTRIAPSIPKHAYRDTKAKSI